MRRISLVIVALLLLSTTLSASESVICKPQGGTSTDPVWSPDGRSIAYVSRPGEGVSNVMLATLSGGAWKTRVLVKDADSPVWSPDSKSIACHQKGMVIVNLASGKVKRLTTDSPDNVNWPQAWSPTGRYLLYTLDGIAGPQPRVMDLQTAKSISAGGSSGGAWTNAGKLIAWTCGEASAIKLVDPASGNSRVLVKDSCAAGASVPKGDAFAYLWLRPSAARGEGIYKVTLKTAGIKKCVALRSEQVVWSKDGAQFAAVSKLIPKAGAEPEMNLYVGNTANFYFKVVSKGLASPSVIGSAISWSPDGKSIVCATADGGLKIVKL